MQKTLNQLYARKCHVRSTSPIWVTGDLAKVGGGPAMESKLNK